jgi:NAD(P)-dependent dehydrogenase (short-subunit alcohol dehydrogenase family)
VASLAAWLVSSDASWMTGQTISLDGGMGTVLPKPRA